MSDRAFETVYKAIDVTTKGYVVIRVVRIADCNASLCNERERLISAKSKYVTRYIDVFQSNDEYWVGIP